MYVFSYFELHTTLIAWQLYGVFYELLIVTGLILLPILWVMVTTTARAAGEENDENHETAVLHIKNVVGAILVILFCLAPAYSVNPTDVKFRPQSPPAGTPTEVDAASDPTTYSEHFGRSIAPVRIPIWWSLVHSLSAGLTNAAIEWFQTPGDLRDTRMLLQSRNIQDPSVAADYNQFLGSCYWPAKDNYQRLAQQGFLPRGQDVSWPGSEYLIGMPGGYGTCTTPENCRWAPATLAEQFHNNPDELARRGLGDTCATWWEMIRGGILDQARADQGHFSRLWDGLTGFLSSTTDRERENLIVRKTLENFHVRDGLSAEYSAGGGISWYQEGVDIVGGAAIFKEFVDMTILVNVMKQALPIMAAVTLLFIVMVIPLGLFFATFSISAVIRLSFLYFSFIFFHALLAFAGWLDHYLTVMLYQGATQSLEHWLVGSQGHLGGNQQKEWLIDIVLMGYYIIMPLLWFGIMGAIGVGAAAGIDGLASGGSAGALLSRTSRSTAGGARGTAYTKGKAAIGRGRAQVGQAAQRYKFWNEAG